MRTPAGHPIHENFRVRAFRQALAAAAAAASSTGPASSSGAADGCSDGGGSGSSGGLGGAAEQLAVLGELMYQSHASYGACGLGSDGTDRRACWL